MSPLPALGRLLVGCWLVVKTGCARGLLRLAAGGGEIEWGASAWAVEWTIPFQGRPRAAQALGQETVAGQGWSDLVPLVEPARKDGLVAQVWGKAGEHITPSLIRTVGSL